MRRRLMIWYRQYRARLPALPGGLLGLIFALSLLTAGCGGSSPAPTQAAAPTAAPTAAAASVRPYEAPALALSAFSGENAEGNEKVRIDLSSVSEGYVAVSAVSDARLKLQVVRDELTYSYDLPSDGTPAAFPLQSGDGSYSLLVMENVSESRYVCIYSTDVEVALKDEFQPYLRPSQMVDYDASSACVKKASELASKVPDALGVVSEVYEYICANVKYDQEKAASVQNGYVPDPDETLASGKGICFDYAALAAAMLRSEGIPTKVIFGYVAPDGIYHAWNMFYTRESGWVTVEFQVKADSWNRLDLTFSANGADAEFIGSGENYTDVYCY